jgi:2-amino-4-hydroxy-6-hydroxymethyldihydropteridine diphosphokinase
LLYDDLVVDEKPVRIPLRPLAELAPDFRHPVTGRTLREHWQEFDAASHPLEVVGVML